ncbi:MAG: DNA-directed RNA polymerase subunit omega [Clostridia bacterium]
MIDPPINELLGKAGDRFTLCIFTAKRARQLLDGAKNLADSDSGKPVTVAINEINKGKITFKKVKSRIKR